jgi:hypothetical protein
MDTVHIELPSALLQAANPEERNLQEAARLLEHSMITMRASSPTEGLHVRGSIGLLEAFYVKR